MRSFVFATTFILSGAIIGRAQVVQDFTLTNVVDGKAVSLSSFQSCEGIVVIFTSDNCAYDDKYRNRIKKLNDEYKGSIQFLLINSYPATEESMDEMKSAYAGWSLSVPYLADKDQTAMECLGARKSPEVFLLKKNKTEFLSVYSGAIDDNPLVETDVNNSHLKNAINQLLQGKKVATASTRAVGCTIRRK